MENNSLKEFKDQQDFFYDVKKIFINNLKAVSTYIIPIIGFGKFLLDVYITTFSVKAFLTSNDVSELIRLFLPHFFIEFYAMTIWLYLSWYLFQTFIMNDGDDNPNKHMHLFVCVIISIILLLVSAIIEMTERRLFL